MNKTEMIQILTQELEKRKRELKIMTVLQKRKTQPMAIQTLEEFKNKAKAKITALESQIKELDGQ